MMKDKVYNSGEHHVVLTLEEKLLANRILNMVNSGLLRAEFPIGFGKLNPNGLCEYFMAREFTDSGDKMILRTSDKVPEDMIKDLQDHKTYISLWIGKESLIGRSAGFARLSDGSIKPITQLKMIGRGINTVNLVKRDPDRFHFLDNSRKEKMSRTIRALGEENYIKLTNLVVGIIGCGRTGSLLAHFLARIGVIRMVLVDPDVVELSNTGEGEFSINQVGQSKVLAIKEELEHNFPYVNIIPVFQSASQLYAFEMLKMCDVLFCCPDQSAPRIIAGVMGVVYLKPLIDIGTQVRISPATDLLGVDVRLILPDRCLFCCGGVSNYESGKKLIRDINRETEYLKRRDWKQERGGSLRSLNAFGVSLALRCFEDWVCGRVSESVWYHAQWDNNGRLSLNYNNATFTNTALCLCRFSGWGNRGFEHAISNVILFPHVKGS